MIKYILKRIGFSLLTIILASSLLFILLQFMPGKPWDTQKTDPATQARLEDEYDLDEPLALQYIKYMGGVFGFVIEIDDSAVQSVDYQVIPTFGDKWRGDKQPVLDTVRVQYPISVSIGVRGLILGLIVGLFFGVISALKRNTFWDHALTMIAVVGVSVPSFVFATILQYYIGFKLQQQPFIQNIPILGDIPIAYDIASPSMSRVLPAFALSLFVIASLTRFMRTELVDVLGSDYILLARAKGLNKTKVIIKHAIRNALIPVITVIGPLSLAILAGSVVIEKIFAIPGMGGELVSAIQNQDNPLILGLAFFYTFLYVTIILIVDVSYGVIDPRVRVSGGDA
ncbi:ABC transporter permease [Haloplasma contractile]|uniref:Oligopeptide ABC trasporter permease protein n=1 Tax=Haloplasma contractile SSD-17B TaxID=1033810 RepID=U2EEK6_9MOLU|nr:ABC transporter permease [Haloplasma contractile]ERJ13403.1 Oligopeptide ABC trasporter permease protein [Haloplasma contractile SSD-17B]